MLINLLFACALLFNSCTLTFFMIIICFIRFIHYLKTVYYGVYSCFSCIYISWDVSCLWCLFRLHCLPSSVCLHQVRLLSFCVVSFFSLNVVLFLFSLSLLSKVITFISCLCQLYILLVEIMRAKEWTRFMGLRVRSDQSWVINLWSSLQKFSAIYL